MEDERDEIEEKNLYRNCASAGGIGHLAVTLMVL